MRNNDLADYLDNDPFLEPSERAPKSPAPSTKPGRPKPAIAPREQHERSEAFEHEKRKSDVLKMVMEVFTGARWTTKEEYRRRAENRDRKGRKKRG